MNSVDLRKTLLDRIEETKPASDMVQAVANISEELATKLINTLQSARGLLVDQLSHNVKRALEATLQTDDDIDINTLTADWLKSSKELSLPQDESVLECANQYAQRVLELAIASHK